MCVFWGVQCKATFFKKVADIFPFKKNQKHQGGTSKSLLASKWEGVKNKVIFTYFAEIKREYNSNFCRTLCPKCNQVIFLNFS